jgi:hypothetical protein
MQSSDRTLMAMRRVIFGGTEKESIACEIVFPYWLDLFC